MKPFLICSIVPRSALERQTFIVRRVTNVYSMARSNSMGTIIFRADQLEREWREFSLCVRCRRGRASKFGNYFLDWLERTGSSISQSHTLTLRSPLVVFLSFSPGYHLSPVPCFAILLFSSFSLAHPPRPLLAFSRKHNYRLRVPTQWMVNGESRTPRPLTYHHKPLVNSDREKRFRGSTISARFSRDSNRVIYLILDRSEVSFRISGKRFNYSLTLLRCFISLFNYTVNYKGWIFNIMCNYFFIFVIYRI